MTGTAFWYASRATGVVSLVLFSLVAILGILVNLVFVLFKPKE